jgi:dTDP-4-dehydrorhamnose reductase
MLRVLITGGGGLLAHALRGACPGDMEMTTLGHNDFDLANSEQMGARLAELRPDVVINTAAYNLVDHCEIERELSWRINAAAPGELARICAARSCRLIHFSTDYVFDGEKHRPYAETDATNPLNHYGAGKLAGEQAVLSADAGHVVLRTSWLFGEHPTQSKTYIHSVLRVVREGKPLKAVHDQHSVPTFAPDLASWTLCLAQVEEGGLFHAVNDEGVSRYAWTKIILEEAHQAGLIAGLPAVEPVPTASFNPKIRRPAYTVMSNVKLANRLGRPLGSWREGLRTFLRDSKMLAVAGTTG